MILISIRSIPCLLPLLDFLVSLALTDDFELPLPFVLVMGFHYSHHFIDIQSLFSSLLGTYAVYLSVRNINKSTKLVMLARTAPIKTKTRFKMTRNVQTTAYKWKCV